MSKQGKLIVISGFSGVGKGTVVKQLVEKYGYSLSVSATTRSPRENEVDGKDYLFNTVEEFRNMIDCNGFIEYAQYVENYYGTPRAFVEEEMEKGHDVILEIEVKGAMQIKEQYPDAILIFISAGSAKELRSRLEGRGTESREVVDKRMKRAREESEHISEYEYYVVNHDGKLDECVDEVHAIVRAGKHVCSLWEQEIHEMQEELA